MAESILRDFLDVDVLAALAGLPLHARSPMLGNMSGRHRSPIRGSSLEFSAYRKYVPGDDIRRLDWRAWGRSDRFYIKEFEADTNLRLCLVIDNSGSMGHEADGESKLAYARRVAGTLACLAAHQGDAVGLFCSGRTIRHEIPPRRNPAHLRAVLDALAEMQPQGETGLAEVLHEVAGRVPQRALIVVLSDLFVQPELLRSCFQHLRFRKHDVAVFHLLENNEIDFDFDGPVRFLDLESDQSVLADPAVIARRYPELLGRYVEDLTTVTREAVVDYHRVRIQDDYAALLARFLLGRIPKRARR